MILNFTEIIRTVFERNKLLFLFCLIFLVAEIIVDPIANLPLNDDWTYAQSVQISLNTGTVHISPISSASLFTHIAWGILFTKIFGFSFNVLRFSTLVSALISALVLNKTIVTLTGSKLAGFMCCMVLLFNPIYFNVSNTFMTDVNFLTLFILCIYFAFEFYRTQKILPFIMVFVFSTLAILLRQYGIIIPVCFALSCVFMRNRRWLYFGLSIVLTFIVMMIFAFYEEHLRQVLPPNSGYKFSGDHNVSDPNVVERVLGNLKYRYQLMLCQIVVYGFPFIAIFFIGLTRNFKLIPNIVVLGLGILITHLLFKDIVLPMGNVFCNMFLGAETFYQTFENGFHYEDQHFSANFALVSTIIKYVFSSGSIACLILIVMKLIKQRGSLMSGSKLILLVGLLFSYAFMIVITEGYFDRYQLPLILISMILVAVLCHDTKPDHRISIIPLILFFYISTCGTKDYLELNRKRWEAFYFLRDRMGVDPIRINGGYEVAGWTWGNISFWEGFMGINQYYLIQYKSVTGYKMVREYEFQRYFPYKKDKIFIFMNLRKQENYGRKSEKNNKGSNIRSEE